MEKVKRFFHIENQSLFLFGPRGTGKSTFIKDAFPDALYLDLLLPDIYRNYSAKPERLREYVYAHPQDIRSLKAFGQDYPEAKRILLYRGKEKLLRDNIIIQPCEEFLRELS